MVDGAALLVDGLDNSGACPFYQWNFTTRGLVVEGLRYTAFVPLVTDRLVGICSACRGLGGPLKVAGASALSSSYM